MCTLITEFENSWSMTAAFVARLSCIGGSRWSLVWVELSVLQCLVPRQHCCDTLSTVISGLDNSRPFYLLCLAKMLRFFRMATGSGKSLCMFLPPLCVGESDMGVIISPLKGLMDQQVR